MRNLHFAAAPEVGVLLRIELAQAACPLICFPDSARLQSYHGMYTAYSESSSFIVLDSFSRECLDVT